MANLNIRKRMPDALRTAFIYSVGIIIVVAIFLATFHLIAMLDESFNYRTVDGTVTMLGQEELSGRRVAFIEDPEGKEWRVYNSSLHLGEKVQLRITTGDDAEIIDIVKIIDEGEDDK